jgi:NitT/TauT family transport system substrate-binding protein
MSKSQRRLFAFIAMIAALGLAPTACGTDGAETTTIPEVTEATVAPPTETTEATTPQTTAAEEMVTITVGDILGAPSAFLQFTVNQGFMEEQGLEVVVEANPGGAANIPGVEAGDFQIAGSNVVSVLLARSQGLQIKMVSAGTFATDDPESDFSQVLVAPDSDIQGPADLNGRTVAVNTLANIAEVTIRAALENAGAEHEDIDFIEMGFPDMVPALMEGRVDAVHVIEPFLSIGLSQGARAIIAPYAGTRPGIAIGSYFSSDAYIAENPDVIDRFIAGVSAGGAYMADNPDELRQSLVDLANLEPAVAEVVNLNPWGGPVDVESVQLIGELMVEFGLIDEVPPMEEVVYQP